MTPLRCLDIQIPEQPPGLNLIHANMEYDNVYLAHVSRLYITVSFQMLQFCLKSL